MNKSSKSLLILLAAASIFAFAACGKHEESAAEKPTVNIENPNEPLKITVSKNGFEPKSIGVPKGQPLKLAFVRTDEENCGEEIVFPAQNIKKPLPLNEVVPVEFTPTETGEIAFTCGMNMLRGKIIVQ